MRGSSLVLLIFCLLSGCFTGRLRAGPLALDNEASAPARADDFAVAFLRGRLDLQITIGAEISIQDTSPLRPNIDYGLVAARFGYMIDTARGHGFFRGNDEVIIEAIAGPIYTGPGSALGGLSLIYRRNFVQPESRFVPYIDLGAGGIYSDASHQKIQRALGTPFEFDLISGLGLRYMMDSHWSIDLELSFRHLSNADFGNRNYGTNALGGLTGLSYSF